MGRSDTVLAKEIKEGSARAFKELFDKYHERLYYLAKNYLKNQALAEDAVQDVLLKFWARRQSLDPSSSVEGLLFTMLKNHLLNMIRDENNRKKVINEVKKTLQKENNHTNVVEEEILYDEYKELLKKALVKLSPAKREVFELRSFEGLSNAEVANKKDVSEHTVKTQYYLSSKFVRNYLKKHGGILMLVLAALLLR
jgi:RNA polymerase sigma-70 factor (ECF subfamily)